MAGRVFNVPLEMLPERFLSMSDIERTFAYEPPQKSLRNRDSAVRERARNDRQDYFFFSKEAMPLVTDRRQKAVIGRIRIDNYLMGVVYVRNPKNRTLELVDATGASGCEEGE